MKTCLVLLGVAVSFVAYPQGCSDAGFCTMGAMKPDQPYNKKIEFRLRTMELSFYRGTTTLTPIIYVATADMNFSLSRKTSFQLKLPFQAVEGRLASTNGMGDISLCITRNIYSSDQFDLNFSVGGKLPTNQSDKFTPDGYPLPMYYQTSLGTYDFITGISLINRHWLLATGIQIPFNQNNNQFVWSAWAGHPDQDLKSYVNEYPQAKELHRGIDVMVRVERNFRLSRVNATIGLLPIYRVKKDEFTRSLGPEANSPQVRVSPETAKGLALSAIVTLGYSFNVQSGVRLLVGHKLEQRETNPDGLTRELVSSFTYFYRF